MNQIQVILAYLLHERVFISWWMDEHMNSIRTKLISYTIYVPEVNVCVPSGIAYTGKDVFVVMYILWYLSPKKAQVCTANKICSQQ